MHNKYRVLKNSQIAPFVFEMKLFGDTSKITAPGQFIDIAIDGKFLRRPFSIADYDEETITIIYKVVGSGTEIMSSVRENFVFDCLTGLGNGFSVKDVKKPLLIGGGVGLPPLYNLAKSLKSKGQNVTLIMGFNKESEIFWEENFKKIVDNVIVTTVDGSYGIKGLVSDAMDINYDYIYSCGPIPMLKAIYMKSKTDAQFSLEERMGCGFGACMGCSINTKSGPKRVCSDGPVFEKGELLW